MGTRETTGELIFASALELKDLMVRGEISPVELVRASLERLEQADAICNMFVTVTRDMALEAARHAESAYMSGEGVGALCGLPISVKDLIPVDAVRHTFGTKSFSDNIAALSAPVAERALAAGACLLGKTTTDELGCKAVGHSPVTGWTLNPWDISKTPGGSSCGAAASVAAGVTPFAIGTDGGGSVRIPASCTNLFAIKPQFARIPVFPAVLAPTLVHAGPMSRTVRDAAFLLSAVAGYDARDPASVAEPLPDFLAACDRPAKGMRIAWSPTMGYARPEREVVELCEAALGALEEQGCSVELVDGPFDEDPLEIWMAEFYAGAGTRLKGALDAAPEQFDPAVRAMLEQAVGQTMYGYYTAVFERYALREQVRRFMEDFDLLATPTLPVPPFDTGLDIPPSMPDANIVGWARYTYPFNLTGQPAGSVPAGFTSQGLPVGLQLVAPALKETDIFAAAAALEQARPWSDKQPALE